jgi:hypothetical protein
LALVEYVTDDPNAFSALRAARLAAVSRGLARTASEGTALLFCRFLDGSSKMRASFHGQNIFALGNGFAKLQIPPAPVEAPEKPKSTNPKPKPPSEPKPPQQ